MLLRTSRSVRGLWRPSGIMGLNYQSPQYKDLIACWPVLPRLPYVDLARSGTNITPNVNGLITTAGAMGGVCLDTSNVGTTHGSNPQVLFAGTPGTPVVDTLTFSCWVRPLATTNFGNTGIVSQWTGGSGWMLFPMGDSTVRAYSNGNHTDGVTAIPTLAWSFVLGTAYTSPSSLTDLYINGLLDASAANGGISLSADLQWGQYAMSNGGSSALQIIDTRLYSRGFNAADVRRMYDPATRWDLYWVPSTRTHFFLSGGGGATLTQSLTGVTTPAGALAKQGQKSVAGGFLVAPTSDGPRSPATVVDATGPGSAAWSNPGNAAASDNSYATASFVGFPASSHYLKATNFSFPIPTGAVISGITLEFERKSDGTFAVDNEVRLVKGGVVSGTNKASASLWPSSDAYASYGGATDLWGLTWTAADVNASNFGAVIAADSAAGGTLTASVDHIRITVHYQVIGLAGTLTSVRTKALSGAVASAGALVKSALKLLGGSTTPAGNLSYGQATASLSGTTSPAGALAKSTAKALAGGSTPAGGLGKSISKALSGALATLTGALARSTAKALAGVLTSAGGLTRSTLKSLSGAVAPTGTLVKLLPRTLAGTLALAGALLKQAQKRLGGTTTPSGSASQAQVAIQTLTGSTSPSGALTKATAKALGGGATPVGALAKLLSRSFAGALVLAGALSRLAGKLLGGSTTPSGAMSQTQVGAQSLSGQTSPTGNLTKSTLASRSGSTAPGGALARLTSKAASRVLSLAGALQKAAAKPLGGALTVSGAVANLKLSILALAGSVGLAGALARRADKVASGSIAPAGVQARDVSKTLAGGTTPTGTLRKLLPGLSLSGILTFVGTLTKSAGAIFRIITLSGDELAVPSVTDETLEILGAMDDETLE